MSVSQHWTTRPRDCRGGQHEEAPSAAHAGGALRQGVRRRQDVDRSVSAQLRALEEYPKANDYSVAREYVAEAEAGTVAEATSLWSGRGQVCCAVSMTVIDLGWGG